MRYIWIALGTWALYRFIREESPGYNLMAWLGLIITAYSYGPIALVDRAHDDYCNHNRGQEK